MIGGLTGGGAKGEGGAIASTFIEASEVEALEDLRESETGLDGYVGATSS